MSKSEQLAKILKTLSTTTPDVEGAAIIDNDGLMIASALSQDLDEDSVAAMSAALLGLGERIVAELKRGDFEMVMIRGSAGFTILVRSGSASVLAALATKNAKLGLIFLDVSRAAAEIGRHLG